jgi:hypothetical protein
MIQCPVFAVSKIGNGGDTIISMFEEARIYAIEIVENSAIFESKGNSKIIKEFNLKKDKLLTDLQLVSFIRNTDDELQDLTSGMENRAAIAIVGGRLIYVDSDYFIKKNLSLYQAIILVIHEVGHISEFKLTHLELDKLGEILLAKSGFNLKHKNLLIDGTTDIGMTLKLYKETEKALLVTLLDKIAKHENHFSALEELSFSSVTAMLKSGMTLSDDASHFICTQLKLIADGQNLSRSQVTFYRVIDNFTAHLSDECKSEILQKLEMKLSNTLSYKSFIPLETRSINYFLQLRLIRPLISQSDDSFLSLGRELESSLMFYYFQLLNKAKIVNHISLAEMFKILEFLVEHGQYEISPGLRKILQEAKQSMTTVIQNERDAMLMLYAIFETKL